MENGKLIFVDEKECGQACSTIILAHCQKEKKDEPSISIGRTVIQKKETDYKIRLCDVKDVLGHLRMLTPSELAMNARELMMRLPHIRASDEKSPADESSDIGNIFSVNGLVLRNFDVHQGSVVFINRGKLDIKNLRYDVDKLEVRRLQNEAFERFEVQTVLYGEKVKIPDKKGTSKDLEILPLIYMYVPYFLAKTLKEHFKSKPWVEIDVIGMVSLTESYICFKREGSRFDDYEEFLRFVYDRIDGSVFNVERKDIEDSHINGYLKDVEECYAKLKKDGLHAGYTNPASLSKVISKEKFDFGIKPIALWLVG